LENLSFERASWLFQKIDSPIESSYTNILLTLPTINGISGTFTTAELTLLLDRVVDVAEAPILVAFLDVEDMDTEDRFVIFPFEFPSGRLDGCNTSSSAGLG
jgi:hypothetical protein